MLEQNKIRSRLGTQCMPFLWLTARNNFFVTKSAVFNVSRQFATKWCSFTKNMLSLSKPLFGSQGPCSARNVVPEFQHFILVWECYWKLRANYFVTTDFSFSFHFRFWQRPHFQSRRVSSVPGRQTKQGAKPFRRRKEKYEMNLNFWKLDLDIWQFWKLDLDIWKLDLVTFGASTCSLFHC